MSIERPPRSARPPEPPSTRTAPAGHTRMVTVGIPLSLRWNLVGEGLGTGSAEMAGGGVGPGLPRPRWGGRTDSRALRVGWAAPRVLGAHRVWPERP